MNASRKQFWEITGSLLLFLTVLCFFFIYSGVLLAQTDIKAAKNVEESGKVGNHADPSIGLRVVPPVEGKIIIDSLPVNASVVNYYHLKNESAQQIEITETQGDKWCYPKVLGKKVLNTGEQTLLEVVISQDTESKLVHHEVLVFTKGNTSPAVMLVFEVKATPKLLSLQPNEVSFGRLAGRERGNKKSIFLTGDLSHSVKIRKIAVDERYFSAKAFPDKAQPQRQRIEFTVENPLPRGLYRGKFSVFTNSPLVPRLDGSISLTVGDPVKVQPDRLIFQVSYQHPKPSFTVTIQEPGNPELEVKNFSFLAWKEYEKIKKGERLHNVRRYKTVDMLISIEGPDDQGVTKITLTFIKPLKIRGHHRGAIRFKLSNSSQKEIFIPYYAYRLDYS